LHLKIEAKHNLNLFAPMNIVLLFRYEDSVRDPPTLIPLES
jgi:hypothetical protein